MGLFKFIKDAGAKLFGGAGETRPFPGPEHTFASLDEARLWLGADIENDHRTEKQPILPA
jgi:hypothetical protein